MQLQRKMRKQTEYNASVRRWAAVLGPLLFAATALLAWRYVSTLAFTVLMVVATFGLLLCNPYNLRSYIPGLNSASPFVRMMLALLCLSIGFGVISLAGG